MTYSMIITLIGFALISSITPGPNNIMFLASGANFGFKRTIPHILGVVSGFVFLSTIVGLGLGQIFETYPIVRKILEVSATAYLIWLAWKIGSAQPKLSTNSTTGKPLTFLQAAAFQWINPKGWSMAISAITIYIPHELGLLWMFMGLGIYATIMIPTSITWVTLGVKIKGILSTPKRLRIFNIIMAILLLATLYPIVLETLQINNVH